MEDLCILFGRRLRELRKLRGLSQEELGELAKVGYKHLGGIERGTKNPSLAVIERLAESLDVRPIELFRYEHQSNDPRVLKQQLEELVDSIEIEELQRIIKLVQAVLQ